MKFLDKEKKAIIVEIAGMHLENPSLSISLNLIEMILSCRQQMIQRRWRSQQQHPVNPKLLDVDWSQLNSTSLMADNGGKSYKTHGCHMYD